MVRKSFYIRHEGNRWLLGSGASKPREFTSMRTAVHAALRKIRALGFGELVILEEDRTVVRRPERPGEDR